MAESFSVVCFVVNFASPEQGGGSYTPKPSVTSLIPQKPCFVEDMPAPSMMALLQVERTKVLFCSLARSRYMYVYVCVHTCVYIGIQMCVFVYI